MAFYDALWQARQLTHAVMLKRLLFTRAQGATYLFESNRHRPYSTRRLRHIVKHYAQAASIEKRVYLHLFRHQLITYLTKQGRIRPKLQRLSGHTVEQSLAVYRAFALSDVTNEYDAAMRHFPVR